MLTWSIAMVRWTALSFHSSVWLRFERLRQMLRGRSFLSLLEIAYAF